MTNPLCKEEEALYISHVLMGDNRFRAPNTKSARSLVRVTEAESS